MTKSQITVLAGAVWVAAFASTAATAHALQLPLALQPPPAQPSAQLVRLEAVQPYGAAEPEPQHFVLPTVEIVSQISRHIPAAIAPPPAASPNEVRDVSEMKCRPFKPLEQGTGGVQICD